MNVVTILVAIWFAASMLVVVFDLGIDALGSASTAVSGIALIACMAYWGSIGGN